MELESLIVSFITIFAIMDPFASLPPFLTLTAKCSKEESRSVADRAVLIAGAVAFVFAVAGPSLLSALAITLSDFRIAGGIVLALLGLETTLGFSLSGHGQKSGGLDSAAVLIATPILTGPGLMTSLVILGNERGLLPVGIALACALLISWLVLRNAGKVRSLVGERVIMVFSKVMGLFLMAIGISFIRAGLMGI
ncbi:MAG TPA: MarC family protein [Candidatus Bilamarchaeum sp.]|nr:MarC family protein [Candidatus Bilamarchaeum sp.]